MAQAHPLEWPPHWPRTETEKRKGATFGKRGSGGYGTVRLSLEAARTRLMGETEKLVAKGTHVVLSTDARLRMDGSPFSSDRPPDDPGAAVYFNLNGEAYCLACDKWDRLPDNVAAIAAHIAAMRGQDRWGVGNTSRAFAGYKAIGYDPAGGGDAMVTEPPWWKALEFRALDHITLEDAEAAYRKLAKRWHPDRPGGHDATFQEINRAIEQAREQLQQ